MIRDSILKTLAYSDHFSFPLTKAELKLRLIKAKVVGQQEFESSLNSLLKSGRIKQTQSYLHLPGRGSLVKLRADKAGRSAKACARARALAQKLGELPGVRAIYLTGSLAVANADVNSDLDFMVITESGRLWTTRLLLTLYTELHHLRRRPGSGEAPGKICLNLYLSPVSYEIPKAKQSLYTAYELIQAVPLYDPYHTHGDLLRANSWLWNYLPNYPSPQSKSPSLKSAPSVYSPLSMLERLAYYLQRRYMSPRLTNEFITPYSAFFHPRDPGKSVLKKLSLSTRVK